MRGRRMFGAGLAILLLAGCHQKEDSQSPAVMDPPKPIEEKAQNLEHMAVAGETQAPLADIIKKTEAQAVDPAGKEPLDEPLTCLARTVYWEARGESKDEMEAVANVVMNRLAHDGFPKSICDVVKQGREQHSCQFSWWCDGRSDRAHEDAAYATAKEIARRALNMELTDRTKGALYFHQNTVSPSWAAVYVKTTDVGAFDFYRPPKKNEVVTPPPTQRVAATTARGVADQTTAVDGTGQHDAAGQAQSNEADQAQREVADQQDADDVEDQAGSS